MKWFIAIQLSITVFNSWAHSPMMSENADTASHCKDDLQARKHYRLDESVNNQPIASEYINCLPPQVVAADKSKAIAAITNVPLSILLPPNLKSTPIHNTDCCVHNNTINLCRPNDYQFLIAPLGQIMDNENKPITYVYSVFSEFEEGNYYLHYPMQLNLITQTITSLFASDY